MFLNFHFFLPMAEAIIPARPSTTVFIIPDSAPATQHLQGQAAAIYTKICVFHISGNSGVYRNMQHLQRQKL